MAAWRIEGQQTMKWIRPVAGVVLLVLGVVWALQGAGAMGHGGGMMGHSQWVPIGVIVAVIGAALLLLSANKLRAGRR